MEDGVKFIFKTLIKVPVIIFFSFFIFNILAFCLTYFKVLGASYVVMQTAVENNYLPSSELNTLCKYVYTLSHTQNSAGTYEAIQFVPASAVIVSVNGDTYTCAQWTLDGSGNDVDTGHIAYYTYDKSSKTWSYLGDSSSSFVSTGTALERKQYGKTTTVGVYCNYKMVWPLSYRDTTVGETGVAGLSSGTTTFKDDATLENERETNNTSWLDLGITYTVPGLKYYPDMLTKS
jgi:hypothetical protein